MGLNAEAVHMDRAPAVSCSGCGFAWNSAAMAEGLRLLGSCPKCGGELRFRGRDARRRRPSTRGRRGTAAEGAAPRARHPAPLSVSPSSGVFRRLRPAFRPTQRIRSRRWSRRSSSSWLAWAVTVPVVLGLARLLGPWSGSHTEESLRRQAAAGEARAREAASRPATSSRWSRGRRTGSCASRRDAAASARPSPPRRRARSPGSSRRAAAGTSGTAGRSSTARRARTSSPRVFPMSC